MPVNPKEELKTFLHLYLLIITVTAYKIFQFSNLIYWMLLRVITTI